MFWPGRSFGPAWLNGLCFTSYKGEYRVPISNHEVLISTPPDPLWLILNGGCAGPAPVSCCPASHDGYFYKPSHTRFNR